MSKIWIWSDLHLNHDKIRLYENRPFKNCEEMNLYLLEQWKTIVKKKETIFNLGDFSWKINKEYIIKILKDLPGKKVLILGNHDRGKSIKWWYDVGFDEVYKYPIIVENFYILSHEPIYLNKNMPYANIHGHIHGEKYEGSQYFNVSVEHLNYKPILFEDIKKQIYKKEIF